LWVYASLFFQRIDASTQMIDHIGSERAWERNDIAMDTYGHAAKVTQRQAVTVNHQINLTPEFRFQAE
jgi:hypothetical protein